ncbi:hypothetical protein LshimejAT787_1701780 [Lyophyllum shimeji]|uniref:DUF6534 domain-containing protein n=1 Tax=Lyophyllum shimeji TaxID=47721 RepID=A0A9P3Q0L3_LYOSH|nr:hypothetical protein LshimejAT787_1701780 [Lyophyllum shimeji]
MDADAQARYIEGIIGPQEVGVMFAIFLLGLVTIQAFTYFRTYPNDPKGIKLLVAVVWALLSAHTLISTFALYRRTVTNYGRISDLQQNPEGMCATFPLSGLIGAIVQSFFAWRLYRLSGWIKIAIICWTLSVVRLGSLLAISVMTCRAASLHEFQEHWVWLVFFALSVSAFLDFMIAGSMSYCLWSRRGDFFKHSQPALDRLIAWTIQTGALTSISSILMLILYAVFQTNWAWMAAYMIIGGMFANYLLASLNARKDFREDMNRNPTFLDVETSADFIDRPQYSLRTVAGRDDASSAGLTAHDCRA